MKADERLTLIRTKVQRAKEHIRELQMEVRAFLSTRPEPYVVSTKRDPKTRELIYYISAAADHVPIKIAAIAGGVINNLRSALDHLAYQLFLVANRGVTPSRHIYFPISESAAKYQTETPGKVKGIRQDAIKAIDALKPYKGGRDILWQIHKLNNIDKHRMLITVGAGHVARSITPRLRETLRTALSSGGHSPEIVDEVGFISLDARHVKCPLKQGDELYRDAADAKVDKDMHPYIEVVFGEPDVLYSTMLAPTLMRMAQIVDDIIVSFKPFLS